MVYDEIGNVEDLKTKKRVGTSVIVFDRKKLVSAKDRHVNYPMLGYLNRFRQDCRLEVIDKLFLKFLERKNIKKILLSALKIYGSNYHPF